MGVRSNRYVSIKFAQNLRSTISAFRSLMLFVTGKRILQTLREQKSNRKLIEIGYLFGLTHHNIFSTLISATLRHKPRLGSRNSQHAIISQAQRLSLRKGINDVFVRLFEDEDLSVTLASDRRQIPA